MFNTQTKKQASFGYAVSVLIIIFAFIMIPVLAAGAKVHVMFILAWLVAIPLCMRLGYSYSELQSSMFKYMPRCLFSVVLLLVVGSMTGAWNASGTIASATYLGLKLINPSLFLLTAFVICLLFAMVTGTSYGTVSTIGLSLMGCALGMGIHPAVAAGPIIGAAFMGDCISPVSDTPNLISGNIGVDLIDLCKKQIFTLGISAVICCGIYYLLSVNTSVANYDISSITAIRSGISENFKISFVSILPIIIVAVLLIVKVPTIPAILCGTFSGFLVAWLYQGVAFGQVISAIWGGYSMNSGNAVIDSLFSRGGITSMSAVVILIVLAFGLFGLLEACGILEALVTPLRTRMKNPFRGSILTIIVGIIACMSSSNSFSIVFTGNFMGPVYESAGWDKLKLGRAMAIGSLLCSAVIPWTANAVAMSGFLHVGVNDFIPSLIPIPVCIIVLIINDYFGLDDKIFKRGK